MSVQNFSIKINSTVAQSDVQLDFVAIDHNIDWDNFLPFSQWFVSAIDGKLIHHELGADLHRVSFEFEDTRLLLTFEEVSGSLWLELDNNNDTDVLTFIASLINKL